MATATSLAPMTSEYRLRVPAVAAGSDADSAVIHAPFVGMVTSVTYTPDTALTGAATNFRTLRLRNKAQDGTGTTIMATQDFVSGVNIAAMDEGIIPLSGTPANLDVAVGDVLAWHSLHVLTGIADPGGLLKVVLSRA